MLSNIQLSTDLPAPRLPRCRRGWALALPLLCALLAPACGDGGDGPPSPPPPPANLDQDSSAETLAAVAFFDDSRVHDVRLFIDPVDWQSIVDDSRGDEWRTATFVIDGAVVTQVGVRPAGESSRVPGNPKMSMRVQFDAFRDGMKVGGVDGVKLSGAWDDPFVFRDRLAYWYLAQRMPTPRETAAVLLVNEENTGAYEIEERWDRDAIKGHFAEPYGALYRVRGMIGADPFAYKGPEAASYVPLPWDPVGSHASDDHLEIGRALGVLANDPGNLDTVMSVENLLDYFAGNAMLANTDGFTGDLEVDDFYEYYDPSAGKLFMLPWDPDNTFGSINDLARPRHLRELRQERDHPPHPRLGEPAGAVPHQARGLDGGHPGRGDRRPGRRDLRAGPPQRRRRHAQAVPDRALRLEPRLREGLHRHALRLGAGPDRDLPQLVTAAPQHGQLRDGATPTGVTP